MARSTTRKVSRTKSEIKATAFNWNSTDAQEIERRRERAREESFAIQALDKTELILSSFRVDSASGSAYTVEVYDLKSPHFSCSCIDFRINGLGTCKHVEATLMYLSKRYPKLYATAAKSIPLRAVVDVDRQNSRLTLDPKGARIPADLVRSFRDTYPTGNKNQSDPEEQLEVIRRHIVNGAPVRMTQESSRWVRMRNQQSESSRLRREYEQNVQSGKWPVHETKVPLFPYQRQGMLHLAFAERALLADEMGLGKTIQAIAACALLHRLGKAARVLVVTPVSLKSEWQEQIQTFTNLPQSMVSGPRKDRLNAYNQKNPAFFTLVNYEQVQNDAEDINAGLRPDIVVLDEAQRIKNWNTKTAQAVKRLRSRYAFVLTGTPIENRIDEIHSIMDFIDPEVLGPLFRFNRDFYVLNENGRPTGLKNLDELHRRISPYLIRRRKADVEDQLPDRTDHFRMVEMTQGQWDAYADFKLTADRLLRTAKRKPLTREQMIMLQSSLSQMRMTCDTNYILNEKDKTCPKLQELRMILEEVRENGTKVIIFSEWVRMLELVRDLCISLDLGFAWHTGSVPQKKRRAEIMAFKTDPSCTVFLSSDSGGTGLNLQVASIVINCDLPWNPAKLEQRIARAWRKNQTAPVTVYNLVSRDTIEEAMLGTLQNKQAIADWVIDNKSQDQDITIGGGRQTFLQKLELMLRKKPEHSSLPADPVHSASIDPMADFSSQLSGSLGDTLIKCEERFPSDSEQSVMLVIIEDKPGAGNSVRQIHHDFTSRLKGTSSAQFQIEVITRSAAEAIEQLEKAGILKMAVRTSRPIYPPPTTQGLAGLSDDQIKRISNQLTQAEDQCQAAEILVRSGLLRHAADHVLKAIGLAVQALDCAAEITGATPFSDQTTSLTPAMVSLWGPDYIKINAFLKNQDDPIILNSAVDAVRGLKKKMSPHE